MIPPGDLLNDITPSCSCGAVFDIRLCSPQILPCSHTFCLMCLSQDLQIKKKRCPSCRKKYKKFRLNIALAEAIERIGVRKATVDLCARRCDECDSRWPLPHMRRCLTCEENIKNMLNVPSMINVLCLECSVDRHSGHHLVRVCNKSTTNHPPASLYQTASWAGATHFTSTTGGVFSPPQSSHIPVSLRQSTYRSSPPHTTHPKSRREDSNENYACIHSSDATPLCSPWRVVEARNSMYASYVQLDALNVQQETPILDGLHSARASPQPRSHKPSEASLTLQRFRSMMKRHESEHRAVRARIEAEEKERSVQLGRRTLSSGCSCGSECSELKNLSSSRICSEDVPAGDLLTSTTEPSSPSTISSDSVFLSQFPFASPKTFEVTAVVEERNSQNHRGQEMTALSVFSEAPDSDSIDATCWDATTPKVPFPLPKLRSNKQSVNHRNLLPVVPSHTYVNVNTGMMSPMSRCKSVECLFSPSSLTLTRSPGTHILPQV